MTATRHAELGASRTERWMHCPGSVRLTRSVPDADTPYAAEGRLAHTHAERALKDALYPETGEGMCTHERSDLPEPDEEMSAAVMLYVNYCLAMTTPETVVYVEEPFTLAALNPPQEMFGTPDFVAVTGRRLDVVDFKYGRGVAVEVNGNTQLLFYVVGALLRHAELQDVSTMSSMIGFLDYALSLFDDIWGHIVQPRASHADGPIRTVHITAQEVRDFVALLLLKAGATLDPDAPLHAGSWCKFCPAQAFCPEIKRYAIEIARQDFAAVEPPPVESLPIEVAASILSKVDVLNHWVKALEARVRAELEAGRPVPGWKLVNKRPTRVWNSVEELHKHFGTAVIFGEPPVRSPAQVEAIVGKKNVPPELYSLVSTGLALAPEHDRRPAAAVGPHQDFPALPRGEPSAEEPSA